MRNEPAIFALSVPGRRAVRFAEGDDCRPIEALLPPEQVRALPALLPEVSEPDVVRHYTALSQLNLGVDNAFYPLGSCTMKYNPRVNEAAVRLPGFAALHPLQDDADAQGTLGLLAELERYLCAITGMDACSLVPAAGAQGEFAGVRMIAAYFAARGEFQRTTLIVPDTAHGTNPASAVMCGFAPVEIASRRDGRIDLDALAPHLDERLAGIMLTNPNTLGLFEGEILEVSRRIHEVGGLLYYDGANLNAIVGRYRPGDMGFDVVHLNTHKTFSTPHGGGGPGCGPVAVRSALAPFLPLPRIVEKQGTYRILDSAPQSIGRLHAFAGNVAVAIRAYAYICRHGRDGLPEIARHAVLNANYLLARLGRIYERPYAGFCMHEFVLSLRKELQDHDVRALDVAKRLLDLGMYAPTVYFPLLVKEGMLIEPTETESLETLDRFVEAMARVHQEMELDPEALRTAPHTTPCHRLDDVLAARKPILSVLDECPTLF